jgi:hypothetical protein
MHIILAGRPEDNRIELLLQVADFDDGFWFSYAGHLPNEDETTMNLVPRLLVNE